MQEHIRVGREYPSIDLNTSYSFGLDDQEFVVAFEGDEPARLPRPRAAPAHDRVVARTPSATRRRSRASAMSVERALNALDGAPLPVEVAA